MKKIILLLLTITLLSCGSDNLSNSKAKKIISKCLEIKPEQRTTSINISKATFTANKHDSILLSKYIKLKDDDYLEMKLIKEFTKGWRKGTKEYSIKLTKDAMEYMERVPEKGNIAYAKTFKYKVDKVLEVQEIPANNTAKAKVQYKAVDITPFAIFSYKDPSEFWIKDRILTKTSNGWKYCDNF